MKKFHYALLFIVLISGLLLRVGLLNKVGRDSITYKRAINELLMGENPYEYTIHTYQKEKQDWDHGFSYFPALLYIMAPFYIIGTVINVDPAILWKIPVLISDLVIAYLLFKNLKENIVVGILASFVWLFNPYIVLFGNYTYLDSIPILFMLLSLIYLEKDDVLSASFFTISVLLKTFPVIIFPLIFFRTKNKKNFIFSGLIIFVLVCIPFLTSIERVRSLFMGSFFVHGERVVQGRPFLYFFSYLTKFELVQIIPTKFYAAFSLILGFFVSFFGAFKKSMDKYVVATLSFVSFYIFTPVLNRTYLLWFLPVLLIALGKNLKFRNSIVSILFFYLFYFFYLYIWIDGFHITAGL